MSTREQLDEFHPDDLVMWHDFYENKPVPVPGVVIRQESECILIRARVQGVIKEVHVSSKELVSR